MMTMKIQLIIPFVLMTLASALQEIEYPWDGHQRALGGTCEERTDLECNILTNVYTGSCGAFAEENDRWCYSEFFEDDICCSSSSSSSDCCDPKAGAIAGVTIAFVVVIALSIWGCCFCCSCCPLHKRRAARRGDAADSKIPEATAVPQA